MPGFTHPVQDLYLEDILALLEAPGGGGGGGSGGGGGRGRGRGRSGRGGSGAGGGHAGALANGAAAGRGATALGPERRAAVEAAIQQAFMGGSDADFDHLLEARPAPGGRQCGRRLKDSRRCMLCMPSCGPARTAVAVLVEGGLTDP